MNVLATMTWFVCCAMPLTPWPSLKRLQSAEFQPMFQNTCGVPASIQCPQAQWPARHSTVALCYRERTSGGSQWDLCTNRIKVLTAGLRSNRKQNVCNQIGHWKGQRAFLLTNGNYVLTDSILTRINSTNCTSKLCSNSHCNTKNWFLAALMRHWQIFNKSNYKKKKSWTHFY